MNRRVNSRGHQEHGVEGRHLKLNDLKEAARGLLHNQYLFKENIPASPRPEFRVSHLKHDTGRVGLRGIRKDNGFRNPAEGNRADLGFEDQGEGSLLWWSLVVGPDEIASAEKRLLETTFPDRTEEQAQEQQSFLEQFTTSPAFANSSRLGSYRFTFPVKELLEAYSEQFCSGAQPMMRVLWTVLYKQEVAYVVLVHSPADEGRFSKYPLLSDDPASVCSYRDGCFTWRPEAMSETHGRELVLKTKEQQMEAVEVESRHEFYVWDNVAVALNVDKQVLKFDTERLREKLRYCDAGWPAIVPRKTFDTFPQAQIMVENILWPDSSPLEHC